MMKSPPERHIIPPQALAKGPDVIRGSGQAFIYTKYPDPDGQHWFVQPGGVGHETMTNSREMLQALFGPRAAEIADEVITLTDVYAPDKRGYPAPTGQKKETYDYFRVRQLAKRENMFGRTGSLQNHDVIMLWGAPENWQAMLGEVIRLLHAPPETVITVGDKNQFLAGDFELEDEPAKKARASQVDADQLANKARFDLLLQYHTATGARKEAIARQLGLHQDKGPRPGSPAHWRDQGWGRAVPYVYSYGENAGTFRSFLQE